MKRPIYNTLRIIKPNGSSVTVKSTIKKLVYKHNVPFSIKPAWRERAKKSGIVYSSFKNLLKQK